jgi:hypothetical protein
MNPYSYQLPRRCQKCNLTVPSGHPICHDCALAAKAKSRERIETVDDLLADIFKT